MLKGFNVLIFIVTLSYYNFTPNNIYEVIKFDQNQQNISKKRSPRKNLKSYKNIKKICEKAKRKISVLETKARKKSTPKIQRCKRAYSELRYQACHLKKYRQRKMDAAKNCAK